MASLSKRLRCCVPYCKRTTHRIEFDEWLCGRHWALIPLQHRKVYGRKVRQWRRYHRTTDGQAAGRLWRWLSKHAINRALGL